MLEGYEHTHLFRPVAGRAGFSTVTIGISIVGRWYAAALEYLQTGRF
jgi:hypothetical protein